MTYIWDTFATPIGAVVAVFAGTELVSCHPIDGEPEWEVQRVAQDLHAVPLPQPGAAAELAEQADAYFAGELQRFEVPLDWRLAPGFAGDALRTIAAIPYGSTLSYGEVAVIAGKPRAARAVGTACRLTPFSLVVPVHRVVRSDGTVGEYGAHPETKRYLLEHEGAIFPGQSKVVA